MKKFFREVKRINWKRTFFDSRKRTGVTFLIGIPVLVGGVALGYQYYFQHTPALIYAHKLQSMTDQVSKTIALPKDETPTVATIMDTKLLPKEKFFSYAANGDKILMYKKHKLAVLYRPSIKEVITEATLDFKNVTPMPVGHQAVAGASTSASQATVSEVPPTAIPSPPQQSSGINTYHPQGKILINPQQ